MSNNAEHIDNFFKENINNVDVKYNPAHWDNLQKALLTATAVGVTAAVATSKWQLILKFLKLYKLFFIVIPSAAVVTTVGVIYFNQKPSDINKIIPAINDSIKNTSSKTISVPDTQAPAPLNKQLFFKPGITTLSDTPKYVSPYSVDTTKKVLQFKKDTIHTSKKDTTKKKNLNMFW